MVGIAVDLSPDDQLLLSGSFDGSVSILDARYGDRLEHYANAHQNKVVEVQWHPTKVRQLWITVATFSSKSK